MPGTDVHIELDVSIAELQKLLIQGQITSVQLVEHYLNRIALLDAQGPALNAIRVVNSAALNAAARSDAQRQAGQVAGLLHGIPVVVKDNYETTGMATTAGSALLAEFQTGRDATLVTRLRAAGAIIIAKSNMHEFAYGITTAGSLFGQTRNPYALDRNAGGSSGGTAAAVAANFAAAGMGSDTCGSIRIPASHNNLVGLRGTQGSSSRFGIVPLSSTQDIGGPIARSAADLAAMLDVTVGPDPLDAQTLEQPENLAGRFVAALADASLQGKRLGLLREAMVEEAADEVVAQVVRDAAMSLTSHGASVVDLSLPNLFQLLDDPFNGFLVLIEDFKWDLNEYLASHPQAPVKSLQDVLNSGVYHKSIRASLQASQATAERYGERYQQEIGRRDELRAALQGLLTEHDLDALVYPTIRREPVAIDQFEQPGSNCRISAKSGMPAISLPAGFTPAGIPVGVELLGDVWSDVALVQLAHAIEQVRPRRRLPNLSPQKPPPSQ